MAVTLYVLLTFTFLASLSQAYPNGAPPTACDNLDPSPGHGPSANNGPAPYDVTFSDSRYTPGKAMEVTLSGKNGSTFEGFIIQAFLATGSSKQAVGTLDVPAGVPYQAVCTSKTGNGLTHTDTSLKSNLTFQWTPPSQFSDDIFFHFTVVRGKNGPPDYFKDIKSAVLKASSQVPTGRFSKNLACGKTIGCYSNCQPDLTCDWLISWQHGTDSAVRLTLVSTFTSDDKYVSLGFSQKPAMYPASVVSCRVYNGKVDVVASANPQYYNQALTNTTEGISDVTGSYNNGVLNCTFLREITSYNSSIYNLTDAWYIITARGDLNKDGSLKIHSIKDKFYTPTSLKIPQTVDLLFPDTRVTTAQTTLPTTTLKDSYFQKDSECGKTKGCYSNCDSGDRCDWLVSWERRGNDTVQIGLLSTFTSGNKYVALGFSQRPGMFKASVVSCRTRSGKVDGVNSFNAGYSNTPLTDPPVDLLHGSFVDGLLNCTFLREATSHNSFVFNLTQPWYLITARGDVSPDGALSQHDTTNRFVTNDKINAMESIVDLSFYGQFSTTPTASPAPTQKFHKDKDCGVTKGCYSNCDDDVCDFLMSWKKTGDNYEIELKSGFDSSDNNYVALGFSRAQKMYPASVVQCISSGGKVESSMSYNSGYSNQILPSNLQKTVTQIKNSFKNGILSCTFTRPIHYNDSRMFDLDQKWNLIAARGAVSGGVMIPHSVQNRFVTGSQVSLADTKVDISLEESSYPLIKLHGCLMILAWILSASIGIAMARYFKPVWPDTKICGVKVWFAIHRASMVIAFCLGVAAFIVIFVEIDGYSEIIGEDYKKAHPILGIIVTALLVINPFMSLLRCAPDHPSRSLFNWAHFLVGTSAHILSAITIAIGMYLPKAQVDGGTALIIIIIYGSWQVLFFCIMSALDYIAKHDRNDYSNLNQIGESEPTHKIEKQMSSAKKYVLVFHITLVVAVAVYLMYMIIETDVE